MLKRQIKFARAVAAYIFEHEAFDLLPQEIFSHRDRIEQDIYIIVLFKAKDKALNDSLVERINASRKMYVSGTTWLDCPASRIAVSNWQVHPEPDLLVVKTVFEMILHEWAAKQLHM